MKIIIILIFIIPLWAANPDDEIIKDIDFFKSLEILKDDNPFLIISENKKAKKDP
jgi:hypothetical protein